MGSLTIAVAQPTVHRIKRGLLWLLLTCVGVTALVTTIPSSAQRPRPYGAPRPYLAVAQDVLVGDATLAGAPQRWRPDQARRLLPLLDGAAADGLPDLAALARPVRDALRDGSPLLIDVAARRAALRLLEGRRSGCCNTAMRHDWAITDDVLPSTETTMNTALAANRIEGLFSDADPLHPWYAALRDELAWQDDPALRRQIMLNMDRWRWMPRDLGRRYILVNAPAFEATLWQDGVPLARWRVVVGRMRSRTPVFSASITGVILNPWWEIPQSIVAESVGALRRSNPREFTRRGYVVQDGRYRQRPGPANALGRMKLVMPNGYAVYLHDTPSQSLFEQEVRVGSHGCVRVQDALGLATMLLADRPDGWTRGQTDAVVATGRTRQINLAEPVPVYIAYFTAQPDDDGHIAYLDDIYGRDRP